MFSQRQKGAMVFFLSSRACLAGVAISCGGVIKGRDCRGRALLSLAMTGRALLLLAMTGRTLFAMTVWGKIVVSLLACAKKIGDFPQ